MRLLSSTDLHFEQFFDTALPPYAVLSHCWGSDEVSHQDMLNGKYAGKEGFIKMQQCCKIAQSRGLEWIWIDTCCIDKTSSAELSEAINAMFGWYRRAKECYAYLQDLPPVGPSLSAADRPAEYDLDAFLGSRYHRRGWTLQELLAPSEVIFLNSAFRTIGSRSDPELQKHLSNATGIPRVYLEDTKRIHDASIAQRFGWISKRNTTRTEDIAYSLLGLFNISMPLLYGEGIRAFMRLQAEILKQSDDESIFAWTSIDEHETGLLAETPRAFAESSCIQASSRKTRTRPPLLASRGVELQLPFTHSMVARFAASADKTVLSRLFETGGDIVIPIDCEDTSSIKPRQLMLRLRHRHGSWFRVWSPNSKKTESTPVLQRFGAALFADPEMLQVSQPGWNLYIPWQQMALGDGRRTETVTRAFEEQKPALSGTMARIYCVFTLVVWWQTETLLASVRSGNLKWLSWTIAKVIQSVARDLALWAWWTMGWQITAVLPGFNVMFMFSVVVGMFGLGIWHLLESSPEWTGT